MISDYKCEGTFVYLDDTTVCGKTREKHDKKSINAKTTKVIKWFVIVK